VKWHFWDIASTNPLPTTLPEAVNSFSWKDSEEEFDNWLIAFNNILDTEINPIPEKPVHENTATVTLGTVVTESIEGSVISKSVVKISPANFELSVLDIPMAMFNTDVGGREVLLTFGGKKISTNQLTAIALTAFCPSEEESLRIIENYLEKK